MWYVFEKAGQKQKMLKHLFAFAILTHCVICRFAPEEREWHADDARENCTELCTDYCIPCTEPDTCNEDEIKCGEKAPENHEDCPPDETCVASNCICK